MDGNTWLDWPVLEALTYFQNIMLWFLNFAWKYGLVVGTIGLAWTGFRLVNARIGVREMLWDTIYKWTVFLVLVNSYVVITTGIRTIGNEVALKAGDSSQGIAQSFEKLKNEIETDIKTYRNWQKGINDELSNLLGREVYIFSMREYDGSYADWSDKIWVKSQVDRVIDQMNFLSKNQKKEYKKKMQERIQEMPKKEQSIYGEEVLRALDSIIIRRDLDGNPTESLINSYVDLNIWLCNASGEETNMLSCSAIMRIGILAGQILWQQSQQYINNYGSNNEEELQGKFFISKQTKIMMNNITSMILAGICFLAIIASMAFAIIQYAMCMIEFAIIQGLGAFFIPFYLFDGTKDLPKKLVPVFTGLLLKIIVMVCCLMFVIHLWLEFASDLIAPENGGIGWVHVANVLFTCILSFILTSNAPKIAMTLLTGQPQLSMGEFMAAVGTLAGGAMMARNAAGFAASPMMNAAKVKMGEAHHRYQASSAAEQKTRTNLENTFDGSYSGNHGTGATRAENKAYKYAKASYMKDNKEVVKQAGVNANNAVYDQQRANYMNNGGVLGTINRTIAHYNGGFSHPVQTLKAGRNFQSPNGMHDFVDVAKLGKENTKDAPPPQVTPDDEQNQTTNVKNKKELPESYGFAPRNT